jgi:hypothetical protein
MSSRTGAQQQQQQPQHHQQQQQQQQQQQRQHAGGGRSSSSSNAVHTVIALLLRQTAAQQGLAQQGKAHKGTGGPIHSSAHKASTKRRTRPAPALHGCQYTAQHDGPGYQQTHSPAVSQRAGRSIARLSEHSMANRHDTTTHALITQATPHVCAQTSAPRACLLYTMQCLGMCSSG